MPGVCQLCTILF